jgi:hypothetical protein
MASPAEALRSVEVTEPKLVQDGVDGQKAEDDADGGHGRSPVIPIGPN